MQKSSSSSDLRRSIELLEAKQTLEGQELKEQFFLTYESLKPINLIENTLKDIVSSHYLTDNILASATGMASGYISKKIVVGTSDNVGRKLIGKILQVGVTNFVAHHPEAIKMFGQFIFQHIFNKKEKNPIN